MRRLQAASLLLVLVATSGCASARRSDPTLGLTRDRYVLPPPPEPPQLRSSAERRALEAEWPRPVLEVPAWPLPPLVCEDWRRPSLQITPDPIDCADPQPVASYESVRYVRPTRRASGWSRYGSRRQRDCPPATTVVVGGRSSVVVVRAYAGRDRDAPPRLRLRR